MTALLVLLGALLGAALSCVLAVLPGLHVYNVLGLLALLFHGAAGRGAELAPAFVLPFMTGMIVGWSMLNTLPGVLLGTPDESALFTVLPGQKYLMGGRGFEGAMITGVGGLAGLFLLVFGVGPLAPRLLPLVQYVMKDHMHWILWVIITFILMSEWPKGGHAGRSGWIRFLDAWKSLGAGLATFLLSGLLGFLLLYRSPVSAESAFQNIMPAFVGLFAIPWCLLNLLSAVDPPRQFIPRSLEIDGDIILRATGSGGLGGGLAAFFPVITGGIGGLLAGHATAQRDERVFLMSQGVSKLVYYGGAFLLFFVPGFPLTRGGGAWLARGFYTPRGHYEYFMILAAIALSGALSFLMMEPLTRALIRLMGRIPYRLLSGIALLLIVGLTAAVTGLMGLLVMTVATGIGLLPVLFASRRLNALGILLLPIACNMSGFGQDIARWLRLL